MTELAKEARRAYKKQWAHDNPDKVRQAQARYWEKKAIRDAQKSYYEKREKQANKPTAPGD